MAGSATREGPLFPGQVSGRTRFCGQCNLRCWAGGGAAKSRRDDSQGGEEEKEGAQPKAAGHR
eukprot:1861420-Pyramimonas_sp.AAC.1